MSWYGSRSLQTAMAALRPWTRWPNILPRQLLATLRPLQVDTAEERSDARCAGMACRPLTRVRLMIRRHLAVREHMMDHILDQSPVSRPRTPSNFALPSPKFEQFPSHPGHQRRGSAVSDIINPLTGQPGARSKSRQNSFTASSHFGPLSTLSPSADDNKNALGETDKDKPMDSPIAGVPMPKPNPQVVTTDASPEVASTGFPIKGQPFPSTGNQLLDSPVDVPRSSSVDSGRIKGPAPRQFQSADQLSSRLPPQLLALRQAGSGMNPASPIGSSPASSPERETSQNTFANANSNYQAQAQAQGQSQGHGAQSAARRMSMLALTPKDGTGRDRRDSSGSQASAYGSALPNAGPPILVNPKCSGYFVEPVSRLQ
jgi:dual specificity phosphatase 12